DVHVTDPDRITIARRLAEAWPRRSSRRTEVYAVARRRGRLADGREPRPLMPAPLSPAAPDEADSLHADRFSTLPPLLAVHLGAGTAAKRWPPESWRILVARFLESGWRVVVVGGIEDRLLSTALAPHDRLRNWTGTLTVTQTTALLERADLFIGADSGPAH